MINRHEDLAALIEAGPRSERVDERQQDRGVAAPILPQINHHPFDRVRVNESDQPLRETGERLARPCPGNGCTENRSSSDPPDTRTNKRAMQGDCDRAASARRARYGAGRVLTDAVKATGENSISNWRPLASANVKRPRSISGSRPSALSTSGEVMYEGMRASTQGKFSAEMTEATARPRLLNLNIPDPHDARAQRSGVARLAATGFAHRRRHTRLHIRHPRRRGRSAGSAESGTARWSN